MALTEKGKSNLQKLAIALIVVISVSVVAVKWNSISNTLGFLTKKVGNVKKLEEADAKSEETISSEVLETVDYQLPLHHLPSDKRVPMNSNTVKINGTGIMWNASASFTEANGGQYTMKESFFDELGKAYGEPFSLQLGRQDDYGAQQDNLVTFTREYLSSKGKVTNKGNALVWFMGDNGEVYFTQTNKKLKALEQEFKLPEGSLRAEAVVISGYSYGEDKFMGPQLWHDYPDSARGSMIAVYPQDGDQNLVIKWAHDNEIPVNPDNTTYCPDAINFAFTEGFMPSAEAVGTTTGERTVVTIKTDDKGNLVTRKTGDKVSGVKITGCGTWTPGDELAFNNAKRAGMDLVSLYSTKDNAHQMPCVIVTVNVFSKDHPNIINAIVEGTVRAGDQMKTHTEAFDHAMTTMVDVYKDKTADYWAKFFKGYKVTSVSGTEVTLGGTRICNLADNLDAFGIGDNSRATYQSSYELFGGFMHSLYPEVLPERLPYSKVVNLAPLTNAVEKMKQSHELTAHKKAEFENSTGSIEDVVGQRSYSIEFEVGKSSFTAKGLKGLNELYLDLNPHDLLIKIKGHTDNQGSDDINVPLSQARADAVYNWLNSKNPNSFPRKRFVEIKGYGSSMPKDGVDPNTPEGRAKCRRVDITVGH